MPGSTSEARSGEPALKYGPSVSAGVGWPEHEAAAPGVCVLGGPAALEAAADADVEERACEPAAVDPVAQAASPTTGVSKNASIEARLITTP